MADYASCSESILRPTNDRISQQVHVASQLRLLKLRVHALGCFVSIRRVEDGSLLPQYINGPQERSWLTKSFDLRPRYRSVSCDYATLIGLECFYKVAANNGEFKRTYIDPTSNGPTDFTPLYHLRRHSPLRQGFFFSQQIQYILYLALKLFKSTSLARSFFIVRFPFSVPMYEFPSDPELIEYRQSVRRYAMTRKLGSIKIDRKVSLSGETYYLQVTCQSITEGRRRGTIKNPAFASISSDSWRRQSSKKRI